MKDWIKRIDQVSTAVENKFGNLSQQQLNWKPNPESWSIAQTLDHLITINESNFPIFKQLQSGTYQPPFIAKIGFMVNFFGKFILKSVQPDNPKRIKTFPIWEPKASDFPSDMVIQFLDHQEELKRYIRTSEIWIKSGVIISSPANKWIVYKLETAFEIILSHEERHLDQAGKILELKH